VHRDAHVVNHVDNVFDLLGIDDVIRQVIIDFGVGQEALFLAARNEFLQLLSLLAEMSGEILSGPPSSEGLSGAV
jgi:hypothetical protein